jgi:hypothetical protein
MITSARLIDLALSAFPRSPRTASTPGDTGKNSCRRPVEVIDVDHGLTQLRQLARRAAVAVSHQLHCDGSIYRLTSDQARDRYGRV